MFCGYPTPPDTIAPQADPSLTKEERSEVFSRWSTSYFRHPYYQASQLQLERTPSNLVQLIPEGVDKYRSPSIESFSAANIENSLEIETGDGDLRLFMELGQDVIRDLTLGTFLDNNSELDMKLVIIYGDASIWMSPWAAWKLEDDVKQWREDENFEGR